MIGIYLIVKGRQAYVGQSINIEKRIESHKKAILKGTNINFGKSASKNTDDYTFTVLEECTNISLNKKEEMYYNKYKDMYDMTNIRTCGEQEVNGTVLAFDKDNVDIVFTRKELIIGTTHFLCIDGFYCLSQIVSFINETSNFNIRPSNIVNTIQFIERIAALEGIDIPFDRKTTKTLKALGIYKTVGARENKRAYCTFNVLVTLLMGCPPQLAMYTLMAITGDIFNK